MKYRAHQYQIDAAKFLLQNPYSALFADPGTGKTSALLMVIHNLKKRGLLNPPVLVTAPLRIATQVWSDEIAKWDQFNGITYEILHGRKKKTLCYKPADIHLVNNEGLPWLSKEPAFDRYQTLIIDESSKFKNWGAQRTKILRYKIRQFKRRHLLTGSPMPRSLLDLFSQMFLCDAGATLGPYLTHYRAKYFIDRGFHGMYPDWQPRKGVADQIYQAIAPSCYRLDGRELLDMPEMVTNDVSVDIGEQLAKASIDVLQGLDLDLPLTAATQYGQSRQIAGGVMSDGKRIHDKKVKALQGIVDELQGKPVLVFFHYREEGKWLSEEFKAPLIYGGTTASESKKSIDTWNRGELPVLLVNPASAGHGLNLQAGGNHIVWFSLTDNQDDYYQGNRRVWRQGVEGTVYVHRLIAKGTVDVAIAKGLESKTNRQQTLLDAIRELMK